MEIAISVTAALVVVVIYKVWDVASNQRKIMEHLGIEEDEE